MNFLEWQNSVVGKPIDVDNVFQQQCVDIAESLCKFLWPTTPWATVLGLGNAKNLYAASNPKYFTKLSYGLLKKPMGQQGDLIVYKGTPSNPDGHIAAVISGNGSDLVVVEQNGLNPNGVAYITHRTYTNCIGLLRPKVKLGGNVNLTNHDIGRIIYLAWGRDATSDELNRYSKQLAAGRDPLEFYQAVINDPQATQWIAKQEQIKQGLNKTTVTDYVNKHLT